MSRIEAHRTMDDENQNRTIALVHPASKDAVEIVLSASEEGADGRSNWVWVRLPNGDLILGVFPQGETYCAVEFDSAYPLD
jgi:hypothetical protein